MYIHTCIGVGLVRVGRLIRGLEPGRVSRAWFVLRFGRHCLSNASCQIQASFVVSLLSLQGSP